MQKLTEFTRIRDAYFDVTVENAVDLVMADAKKTKEAREQDAEFIRRLRRNEFVAFGARDWKQQERFDRAEERKHHQEEREEREIKRQKGR